MKAEETLITQNGAFGSITRGSEPIERTISVIDETGKEYEATYPKRARGLVKKGRARFVDQNTICLACPPNIMEDTKMSDNNIKTKEAINATVIEKAGKPETVSDSNAELKLATAEYIRQAAADKKQSNSEPMLTVGYILRQIEKIQQDNEHIYKALETLSAVVSGQGPGDVAGEGKAKGIADTVKCRETTNQKLIAFYEKLYDDIKPVKSTANSANFTLDEIITAIERCDAGVMSGETSGAIKNDLRAALMNKLDV